MKINGRIAISLTVFFVLCFTSSPLQAQAAKKVKINMPVLKVGATGPGGGIIFYDKGNDEDGWRYLEAAPNSVGDSLHWGALVSSPLAIDLPGLTEIGVGKLNTDRINWSGNSTLRSEAVTKCVEYRGGGFDDWFLPSKDELNEMYKQRKLLNIKEAVYWSSSRASMDFAWCQDFGDGTQVRKEKWLGANVYPIRAFTAESTRIALEKRETERLAAEAIRLEAEKRAKARAKVLAAPNKSAAKNLDLRVGDIGPGGGKIFYDKGNEKDGWQYLEAAEYSVGWPNLWVTGVGARVATVNAKTETGIGTGKANTAAMIEAGNSDLICDPAILCDEFRARGLDDWFLPSKDELNELYKSGILGSYYQDYWSSSHADNSTAWKQNFRDGKQNAMNFIEVGEVRPIRAFTKESAWIAFKRQEAEKLAVEKHKASIKAFDPSNMVRIEGGTFTMGQARSRNQPPGYDTHPRQVTVSSFYINKYEVTQKEYKEIMGYNATETGDPNRPNSMRSNYQSMGLNLNQFTGDLNLPVDMASWYEAVEYCNKLSVKEGLTPVYTITGRTPATGYPITAATVSANWSANGYRLPTEAEWEYACRAGTTTPYYTGNQFIDETGWIERALQHVGTKPPNPWGLYDMHGNVVEWCWDLYDLYASGAQTNPRGPTKNINGMRVYRGGGSAGRGAETPSLMLNDGRYRLELFIGFRVVRNAE